MNPDLSLLQPYPFERLAELNAGVVPPADLQPIPLSIGEPKHTTPAFIAETIISHLHGLSQYPLTRGQPALREAIGDDLFDRVEVEVLMDDPASTSRIDTPLWDSLERAVSVPFPEARLNPQFIVGFTDARVFRDLGAVAYGAGLFSPAIDPGEFGQRFHGHNERIDVESLRLTTELWERVVTDLLG